MPSQREGTKQWSGWFRWKFHISLAGANPEFFWLFGLHGPAQSSSFRLDTYTSQNTTKTFPFRHLLQKLPDFKFLGPFHAPSLEGRTSTFYYLFHRHKYIGTGQLLQMFTLGAKNKHPLTSKSQRQEKVGLRRLSPMALFNLTTHRSVVLEILADREANGAICAKCSFVTALLGKLKKIARNVSTVLRGSF